MANTYVLIEEKSITSGTSFTFSSIPQTYKDLILTWTAKTTYSAGGGAENFVMNFNGTTTGYLSRVAYLYNTSTTLSEAWTTASGFTGGSGARLTYGANTSHTPPAQTNLFSINTLNIFDYASSNYKTWLVESTVADEGIAHNVNKIGGGVFTSATAVTSILIGTEVGSFVSGTNFCLYGIKNS